MKCCCAVKRTEKAMSHPARGAWIEMTISRSVSMATVVAPRKGCVD